MREWGLTEHAAAMGVKLSTEAVDQFHVLLAMLAKWNRVYNLTSIRDEELWVSHHLLDSLAIMPILPTGRAIDVGSGGGFPGMVLGIADGDREMVLLDSSRKKTSFLRQAVAELGLANITVATSRVEHFRPPDAFDVVISRAFSDLKTFMEVAAHLCNPGGRMLAMKGMYPQGELDALPSGIVTQVIHLEVPTLEAKRHAVFLDPSMHAEVS